MASILSLDQAIPNIVVSLVCLGSRNDLNGVTISHPFMEFSATNAVRPRLNWPEIVFAGKATSIP